MVHSLWGWAFFSASSRHSEILMATFIRNSAMFCFVFAMTWMNSPATARSLSPAELAAIRGGAWGWCEIVDNCRCGALPFGGCAPCPPGSLCNYCDGPYSFGRCNPYFTPCGDVPRNCGNQVTNGVCSSPAGVSCAPATTPIFSPTACTPQITCP